MKKLTSVFLAILVLFITTSCADSKTYVIDGEKTIVEPYGWAEPDEKVEGIKYKASIGNVVFSIIFVETIIVPIWLTGWELYEPVECVICDEANELSTP